MFERCYLCKHWNPDGKCDKTDSYKDENDFCSSFDSIPCCQSCSHWERDCDDYSKGYCSVLHGNSPYHSICKGDHFSPKSSGKSTSSGTSSSSYKSSSSSGSTSSASGISTSNSSDSNGKGCLIVIAVVVILTILLAVGGLIYDNFINHSSKNESEEYLSQPKSVSEDIVLSGTYIGCTYNGDMQKFESKYEFYSDGTFRLNTYEYSADTKWELCGGGLSHGTYSADGEKIFFHSDDIQNGKSETTYYYRLDEVALYLGETNSSMNPFYKMDHDFSSLAGYTMYSIFREDNEISVKKYEFRTDGTFQIGGQDYSNVKYDPFPDAETDTYGWYVQPKGYPNTYGSYYTLSGDNNIVVMHSDYIDNLDEYLDEYDALMLLYMSEDKHTLITSDETFYLSRTNVDWESICPFFEVSLD